MSSLLWESCLCWVVCGEDRENVLNHLPPLLPSPSTLAEDEEWEKAWDSLHFSIPSLLLALLQLSPVATGRLFVSRCEQMSETPHRMWYPSIKISSLWAVYFKLNWITFNIWGDFSPSFFFFPPSPIILLHIHVHTGCMCSMPFSPLLWKKCSLVTRHTSLASPPSAFLFLYFFGMPDFCHCKEGKVLWKWGCTKLAKEDTDILSPDPIISDPAISLKSVGVSECGSVARLGLWWTVGWRGENGEGLKENTAVAKSSRVYRFSLWWARACSPHSH